MKGIGEILKNARRQKRYSLAKLEQQTKIKESFIANIENQIWESLPEYPVLLGFVKTLAKTLDVDPESAVAVLRRDYPPKVLHINPKPDVEKKIIWSPKTTFVLLAILAALTLGGYLLFQYSPLLF